MGKWSGRSWWSSLGLGKRAADDADDFGDMGTAFGLDASMAGEADAGAPMKNGRPETEAPASPADRQHRRSRY
jgi:hypothetical protein